MASSKKKKYALADIVPLLSEDSLKVASGIIEQSLFMEEQLTKLMETIKEEGASENYQYGSKPTASMETFLKMQKSYGVNIRFLADLLPKSNTTAANANLLDWVNAN